jgi:glutamate/tyrosine decarboxylase-like PLP-dependent enzyme
VATSGGRYFGFVVGSSLPATLAANWLAGAWDQNAGGFIQSPAAGLRRRRSRLEEVATKWMLDVLGLPDNCGAGFVTCATTANVSALAAARPALFTRKGWDVDKRGLFGAPAVTVVVGEEVHVSVLKALGLLDLRASAGWVRRR